MPVGEDVALLNFLHEPVFVLESSGAILQVNNAAKRLIGGNLVGRNLAELVSTPDKDLRHWLRRCSGTTAPLIGSLTFQGEEGNDTAFRTYGARLAGGGNSIRIALRCVILQTDAFAILSKQVKELNAENRQQQQAHAILEEALADNKILLRELNHRVKNNLQIIYSLFSAAQRESNSEEVRSFVEGANRRLLAMGAAHELMYQSPQMRFIRAASFVQSLCEAFRASIGDDVRLAVTASEDKLSNEVAFPLGLILNELLANAFKHGLKSGGGTIGVTLERAGGDFMLSVHDSGPGFSAEAPERRASGLGLVRGLCRQIGAQLSLENAKGAKVCVKFDDAGNDESDATDPCLH